MILGHQTTNKKTVTKTKTYLYDSIIDPFGAVGADVNDGDAVVDVGIGGPIRVAVVDGNGWVQGGLVPSCSLSAKGGRRVCTVILFINEPDKLWSHLVN